ncbi:hypothetical protein ACQ4LE_002090 [Meloidogyne hapla]
MLFVKASLLFLIISILTQSEVNGMNKIDLHSGPDYLHEPPKKTFSLTELSFLIQILNSIDVNKLTEGDENIQDIILSIGKGILSQKANEGLSHDAIVNVSNIITPKLENLFSIYKDNLNNVVLNKLSKEKLGDNYTKIENLHTYYYLLAITRHLTNCFLNDNRKKYKALYINLVSMNRDRELDVIAYGQVIVDYTERANKVLKTLNKFVLTLPELATLEVEYSKSPFRKVEPDSSYENYETIGLYVPLLFTVHKGSGTSSSNAEVRVN